MKKLILAVVTIISSLSPSQVLAQLSLTCSTQGSLTLINKSTLSTTQPAQCNIVVDNTVPNLNVTITLSEPILKAAPPGKEDPSGTSKTARLTYSHNGNQTINQNSSITDTFSGSSITPLELSMQIQRQKQFFAGYYTYDLLINITSP
jgi:hypothetical protein